jgi:glutamate synthase (ferredoxin)
MITEVLAADGIPFLGWRDVPVDPTALGATAASSQPWIAQCIVGRPAAITDDDAFERELYLARRDIEHRATALGLEGLYCCSFSHRTIVYKALLTGTQLPHFYPDLRDPRLTSAIAVFHERYATNTLPRWELAQPFRFLAHNGEINTLWGNRNAMAMRHGMLSSTLFGDRIERLRDVIVPGMSDSASLDNALELLHRCGRSPVHAVMMLIPQAWEKYPDVEPAIKAFYEYHQCVLEPWDGPAAIAYSDGRTVAVSLDRNGLRPCRYKIRSDGMVCAGSEVGIVDFDPAEVIESGKLGPAGVFVVDTVRRRIVRTLEAKREVAAHRPFARWVAHHMLTLPSTAGHEPLITPSAGLRPAQLSFGYTFEDLRLVLEPMATGGADAVWSMGDDAPIAPLSATQPPLYSYLRQRFAQVTNPPIDSLRESLVMSLRMHLGRRGSPLEERASYARMLRVEHPILLPGEMESLREMPGVTSLSIDATFEVAAGPDALAAGLDALCRAAERAARRATILIISDRAVSATRAPIPMALAIGAVRQRLVQRGLRARVGLVAEAGDVIDPHHAAVLVGYGAEAVHPWLAMATAATMFAELPTHGRVDEAAAERPSPADAQLRVRTAMEKGLLKILAKMGISTLASYCGAQIFEALGLGREVIERAFQGTPSLIGGIGLSEIGEDVLSRHARAFATDTAASLPDVGRIRYRKDGEQHAWAPPAVMAMQRAVGGGRASRRGAEDVAVARDVEWRDFVAHTHVHAPAVPRDLLTIAPLGAPLSLDAIEPVEAITARFISSAMSLGSLSPEAHATLSTAMNRIGARSNSGEGGEDPAHYGRTADAPRVDNRIKQVASGRFGVTTEYLVRADELEIKIVQGAKPGEGGQLPAHKVTDLIARLRHSTAGVSLISPPPHHDIYSIEDLAQLVADLKAVNPRARVGVKLVAEAGVGTVAAGVAKAYADYVLIAGHNGGTGASPLSSIKHAGSPWEIGLAEAQQVLVRNQLRHRVELRVDGGLRTGRDVIVGALLGAEAFGFGTAALVAIGCAMARQCHANTCPTGIATQRDDLRAKYTGTAEHAVAFFTHVANDVRSWLAQLGAPTLDALIGRADLLRRAELPSSPRATMLDLSVLRTRAIHHQEAPRRTVVRNERRTRPRLDDAIVDAAAPLLERGASVRQSHAIHNHDLTVGARLAGWIAERHGDAGLPADRVQLDFRGTAGQSFGAFAIRGMSLTLEGEANDYVGKGLNGASISIRPFATARYRHDSHRNVIVGNTVLYGATAGRLFAAGQAGDRFAVRNSGAIAVIEGAGGHCCEYMTGGIVLVLGRTGRNVGAGMSNGVAYLLDEDRLVPSRINHESVLFASLDGDDERVVRRLLEAHWGATASPRARAVLDHWAHYRSLMHRVEPRGAATHVAAIRQRFIESG